VKVIGICGSPRKGNTEILLREALNAAKKAGAETDLILLKNLDIRHCDGCNRCVEGDASGLCYLQDEMQELYKRMESADVIILGSPNYYDNVTGTMKDFIDRSRILCRPGKLAGKLGGIIVVGGENTTGASQALKTFFTLNKIKLVDTVEAVANEAGEVSKNKDALLAARGLGKDIAEMLK
jgi:multimeric flavodoxin WrbA